MKRKRMSIEEAMHGEKKRMSVKQMCNKRKIPLYYVMGEDHRITPAHFGFCQHMYKTGQYLKAPFPEGEILVQIEDDAIFWFSTSRESLIAVMENRKEPWLCVDLRKDNK